MSGSLVAWVVAAVAALAMLQLGVGTKVLSLPSAGEATVRRLRAPGPKGTGLPLRGSGCTPTLRLASGGSSVAGAAGGAVERSEPNRHTSSVRH